MGIPQVKDQNGVKISDLTEEEKILIKQILLAEKKEFSIFLNADDSYKYIYEFFLPVMKNRVDWKQLDQIILNEKAFEQFKSLSEKFGQQVVELIDSYKEGQV
jgi:hypothetical protein